jgi:hypothetical protein
MLYPSAGRAVALGGLLLLVATNVPVSEAVAAQPSNCTIVFDASVRTGPAAGVDFAGELTLRVDQGGRVSNGTLVTLQGEELRVHARSHDRAIDLRFDTSEGVVRGTGRIDGDTQRCLISMGGSFTGPGKDNAGSWSAASSQSITLASGAVLESSPTADVLYRRPSQLQPATVYAGVLNTPGNTDGLRTSALFNQPAGIDQDATRQLIWVADVGNAEIRQINQTSGQVTTILRASNAISAATTAGYTISGWSPQGVGVDSAGNLFIADNRNYVMWYYNISNGRLRLLAGKPGIAAEVDGTGTAARFLNPTIVAMNAVRSTANVIDGCVVRQVDSLGDVLTVGSSQAC